MPLGLITGLACIAVALGMLTPWALLAFGAVTFVIGAWDLKR